MTDNQPPLQTGMDSALESAFGFGTLELRTIPYSAAAFTETVAEEIRCGARTIRVSPRGSEAALLEGKLRQMPDLPEFLFLDSESAKADNLRCAPPGAVPDIEVLLHNEEPDLAQALLRQLDRKRGLVLAPALPGCGLSRPLFLVSVPKAGTHLLIELARALGFDDGLEFDGSPTPGRWHYLEFTNCHTAARDFFVDSVRRAPHGNRLHPFPSTPTLFIYRHPYDVLVSEANYYHKPGKTAFSGYLAGKNFEDRVLRLIDDPWLLGSLRDRVGQYCAWLDFQNVIPVSFEELVGARGGGTEEAQQRLIWSVLLKLQVSGVVDDIARTVFNPDSATFNAPRIGAHRERLNDKALARLGDQPNDYMDHFGYCANADSSLFSSRNREFQERPLLLGPSPELSTPVLHEQGFLEHNIVSFRGTYYALPIGLGPVSLSTLPDVELNAFLHSEQVSSLKSMILDRIVGDKIHTLLGDCPERLSKQTLPDSASDNQATDKTSHVPRCRISVITVVRNAEQHIEKLLQSVSFCTAADIEHIVIAGISADSTTEILERHRTSLAHLIIEADSGPTEAINKAIPLVTGDYVGFLLAGDWYEPGALDIVAAHAGEGDVLYGDAFNWSADASGYLLHAEAEGLPIEMSLNFPATFFKASLVREVGAFNNEVDIASDYDFCLRCMVKGATFKKIDAVLANMTLNGRSATHWARGYWHAAKSKMVHLNAGSGALFFCAYQIFRTFMRKGFERVGLAWFVNRYRSHVAPCRKTTIE